MNCQKRTASLHCKSISEDIGPIKLQIRTFKTRTILTEQQAISIFQIKLAAAQSKDKSGFEATAVAKIFGVSDKAIRDIWKGRTWFRETMHLDSTRAADVNDVAPRAGRPKRSKSKPRSGRSLACSSPLIYDSNKLPNKDTETISTRTTLSHQLFDSSSPKATALEDCQCIKYSR